MKYILPLLVFAACSILLAQNLPTEMLGVEIGKPATVDGWKLEESGDDGDVYSIVRPHPRLGDNTTLSISISPTSRIVDAINLEAEFSDKSDAEAVFNNMKREIEEQYNITELPITSSTVVVSAYYRSANNRNIVLGLKVERISSSETFLVNLLLMDIGLFRALEKEAKEQKSSAPRTSPK